MFISHHTLKWTRTCRSFGDFPHAHTAHFLLNRHKGRADLQGIGRIAAPRVHHAARLPHVQSASRQPREGAPRGAGARHPRDPPGFPHGRTRIREDACPGRSPGPRRTAGPTGSCAIPAMACGTPAPSTPPGRWNAACLPRPARSATPMATPWPRASTARTRPDSSGGANPFRDLGDPELATFRWVSWRDSKRPHRSLGHRTPQAVEIEYHANQAAQAASL